MNKTIIFCTDNTVSGPLFDAVVRELKRSAAGIPIISVSHEPIDLGRNICIGKQKRSWLCLYRQLCEGLKAAETDNISIAEHDCFYSAEHLNWTPPKDDTFYYNENMWLVQWADNSHPELKGMFSRFWKERLALSQLICNRELYLEVIERRLDLIDKDRNAWNGIDHIGEPGYSRIKKAQYWAKSGRAIYLKDLVQDTLELERYETFRTEVPNLDVRHDSNFTGPKRGKKRTFEVPYWGRFEDLINRDN